jgi:hypothetical protein
VGQKLKACGEQREVENGPRVAEENIKQEVKDVGCACPQMNTTPREQEDEFIQFNSFHFLQSQKDLTSDMTYVSLFFQ